MANWIDSTPLYLLAIATVLCLGVAAVLGALLRRSIGNKGSLADDTTQDSYIVSAILGLLALFMGFTLSIALDRFETRRTLVLEEANAIGTAYLRTQLLGEPHRDRLGNLLVAYLDNRIAYNDLSPSEQAERLSRNDELLTDLWAATTAAFDDIRHLDFSSSYLDSINAVIDLDTSRKTAGTARVPAEIFALLFLYLLVAGCILGFILTGRRRQVAAGFVLVLVALAFVLMLDIDRPSLGLVKESQEPLLSLRSSIAATPAGAYDKWRQLEPQS